MIVLNQHCYLFSCRSVANCSQSWMPFLHNLIWASHDRLLHFRNLFGVLGWSFPLLFLFLISQFRTCTVGSMIIKLLRHSFNVFVIGYGIFPVVDLFLAPHQHNLIVFKFYRCKWNWFRSNKKASEPRTFCTNGFCRPPQHCLLNILTVSTSFWSAASHSVFSRTFPLVQTNLWRECDFPPLWMSAYSW